MIGAFEKSDGPLVKRRAGGRVLKANYGDTAELQELATRPVCASWWAHIKCAKHFIGQWHCQS